MKSIGTNGERTTAAAARRSFAGETMAARRSPPMRLPIWSWFCAKTTNCAPSRVLGRREVLQERLGGVIDDGVHGVDAQRIDVKLLDPLQGVVDEEPAHVVAVRPVEVQRRAPRRLVAVGKVRSELGEVVPLRAEVV